MMHERLDPTDNKRKSNRFNLLNPISIRRSVPGTKIRYKNPKISLNNGIDNPV